MEKITLYLGALKVLHKGKTIHIHLVSLKSFKSSCEAVAAKIMKLICLQMPQQNLLKSPGTIFSNLTGY